MISPPRLPQDLVLGVLPDSARALAELVGVDAVLAIVRARGGVRLYVPAREDPEHWLCRACGPEAYRRLVWHYAGEEIDIPACRALLDQEALAAHDAGESVAALALAYRCTERGMRARLARARVRREQIAPHRIPQARRQADLFG